VVVNRMRDPRPRHDGRRDAGLEARIATAPIAAAGLIAGFGIALATGSRPLGGVVLAACGLVCVVIWLRRDGRRTAALLTIAGLFAFAVSHVLGLLIGPWPAVIAVAAATATVCWRVSDSHQNGPRRTPSRPAAGGVVEGGVGVSPGRS
jgi:hypothetical protein